MKKKSKFLPKIDIFCQTMIFLAKIGILVKNRSCGKTSKFQCKQKIFDQKKNFWRKIRKFAPQKLTVILRGKLRRKITANIFAKNFYFTKNVFFTIF